jgi:hypothetical protein
MTHIVTAKSVVKSCGKQVDALKRAQTSERLVQRQIIEIVRLCFPTVIVHHSPNAHGKRGVSGMRQAMSNRADGCMTGWPDLMFIWPGNVAFAEIKRPGQAHAVTKAQAGIIDTLRQYGFPAVVLTDALAARVWLTELGAPGWNGGQVT